MRQSSTRSLAQGIVVLLVLALLAPAVACAGDSTTAKEASECCRAMHFACHGRDGSACCKHQASAPPLLAVLSVAASVASPLTTAARLPALAKPGLVGPSVCGSARSLPRGHSPPSVLPLFILHSVLLI